MPTIGGNYTNPYAQNTQNTTKTGSSLDVVVDQGKKGVSVDDFLNLMVAQLTNQDFMNPMEDTQYVTQLAQFATMQHMQELAYNSKLNYVSTLVGKQVTVARLKLGGEIEKVEGTIQKIALMDNEFSVYVNDKAYTLEQVMEIHEAPPITTEEPDDADNGDETDGADNGDQTTEQGV